MPRQIDLILVYRFSQISPDWVVFWKVYCASEKYEMIYNNVWFKGKVSRLKVGSIKF